MNRYFVDSNIFLRFYCKDDEKQRQQARELLLKAQRKEIELYCGPPVFFEVAWVLVAVYSLSRDKILDTLETMLYTPNLYVIDEEAVKDAIDLARTAKLGFADSYVAVTARRLEAGVATFNKKHFLKVTKELYLFEDPQIEDPQVKDLQIKGSQSARCKDKKKEELL